MEAQSLLVTQSRTQQNATVRHFSSPENEGDTFNFNQGEGETWKVKQVVTWTKEKRKEELKRARKSFGVVVKIQTGGDEGLYKTFWHALRDELRSEQGTKECVERHVY